MTFVINCSVAMLQLRLLRHLASRGPSARSFSQVGSFIPEELRTRKVRKTKPRLSALKSSVSCSDNLTSLQVGEIGTPGTLSNKITDVLSDKAKGKYDFTHKNLPDETIYILDGTAMLYSSYFNSLASRYSNASSASVNSAIEAASPPLAYTGGVLARSLNDRIVAEMTDAEVAAMIAHFSSLQSKRTGAPAQQASAAPESNAGTENLEVVTQQQRDELILRCEPLVVFFTQFAKLVRDLKPKYVAVAFDAGRTTFRNGLFPAYKQQRSAVSWASSFCTVA
jgi:hypothetical protein